MGKFIECANKVVGVAAISEDFEVIIGYFSDENINK